MKSRLMRIQHWAAACLISFIGVAALADDAQVNESADRISSAIRQAGLRRVAVLPMLFEFNSQQYDAGEFNAEKKTDPELRSSLHGRLYADQMQTRLAELSGDVFRLVDSMEVADALKATSPDLKKLRGTSKDLKPLATAVDGGLQGLVVGTIRDRPLEQDSLYSVRDVNWKLLDLTGGTIVTARNDTAAYSLADDVYAGRSQEFFRWDNGRLWAIGFGWSYPGNSKISLNPRDSLDLFGLYRNSFDQPNPILNPRCPFKVKFTVEGNERSLMIPVAREAQTIGGMNLGLNNGNKRNPNELFGHPLGSEFGSGLNSAYLPLHPGEGLKVHVTNSSSQPVMVAAFVDGINVLGKKRQVPDDKCRVWRFDAQRSGTFAGWYTGEAGKEQVEPFVITPWEDSAAGKLGQTERVGTITLVFFTEGWPTRQQIASHPRTYQFFSCWDAKQKRVLFREELAPPAATAGAPTAGAPADGFAMGSKKPQPNALIYQKSQPQGTILAAMTVCYGTKADIPEIERERIQNKAQGYLQPDQNDQKPKYMFVEAPTNGQVPHQNAQMIQTAQPAVGQPGNRPRFGAHVTTSRAGVQVTGVMANSPATRCQNGDGKNWTLTAGDVITQVNGQPVQTEAEYRAAVRESAEAMQITVIGGTDRRRYEFSVQLDN